MIKNIFIASEVRSGSTFVAELISYSFHAATGVEFWDLAHEKFDHINYASTSADIENSLHGLWVNQADFRSAKLMCASLSVICREAHTNISIRDEFFGDRSFWIILQRRNKIRQAISLATARKSGVWHNYSVIDYLSELNNRPSHIDIMDGLRAVVLSNHYLDFFSTMPKNVLCANYEDVIKNPQNFLDKINDFIPYAEQRVKVKAVSPKLQRSNQQEIDSLELSFSHYFISNYHYNPLD